MPIRWLGTLGLALTPSIAGAAPLSCVAAYQTTCEQRVCRTEAVTGAVRLTLDPARGRGELCTYSYCRAFVLIRYRGDNTSDVVSGLVVSAKRGSVPPRSREPEVDMLLTVDLKKKRFGLTDGSATGLQGWFGRCR
ncbi:MAG: hypothetical protein OEQ29_03280 [Alphaproteobacteria bacterium]|nr:hypothetical protein [Alphaproteobacteria bacterium]